MRPAVIDDIVFQAAALGKPASTAAPSLAVHVPAAAAPKGFTHPVPFFARRPPVDPAEQHWPAYCGLLKDFGVPLQSPVASLERLSVANVPLRLAKRHLDEPFDALELETAEAIELSCVASTPGGELAQLPLEAAAWPELKALIGCVRELSGGATPIGLGMLAGDVVSDVGSALATGADFVILQFSSADQELTPAEFDRLVWSVAAARGACIHAKAARYPIYVDAPVTESDDIVKLLALGASAVSIDALAATVLPASSRGRATPHGMLSGIGGLAPQPVASIKPLESKLGELSESLKTRLRQLKLNHVSQLCSDHLRALTETAARLSGVRLLGG